jgi:hypothetical protein
MKLCWSQCSLVMFQHSMRFFVSLVNLKLDLTEFDLELPSPTFPTGHVESTGAPVNRESKTKGLHYSLSKKSHPLFMRVCQLFYPKNRCFMLPVGKVGLVLSYLLPQRVTSEDQVYQLLEKRRKKRRKKRRDDQRRRRVRTARECPQLWPLEKIPE